MARVILAWLVLTSVGVGAQRVPTLGESCHLALRDARSLGQQAPYYRYLLTYERTKEFYGSFSYAINTSLNHASTGYKPEVVADGWLLRIDLRKLWPQREDQENLSKVLEKLVTVEPYYHTLGEKQIVKKTQVLVDVPAYQHEGRTYTKKWVEKEEVVEVLKGAEFSLHLGGVERDMSPILELSLLCQSNLPIMRADWFMFIILSQDPTDNGRYYEFAKIEQSDKERTAETKWLNSMGVSYETIKKIRTDQRIAKWKSKVTGTTRAVEYFFTSATRPAIGPSAAMVTRDWFSGKIDPTRHPIKNLVEYKPDGGEGMGLKSNGFITFILVDGKGNRVNVAPQNLACDRTVPSPYPTTLQPPISCIRCHGPTELWMNAYNDILVMTKGRLGVDIFDDPATGETPEDALDRIAGLYTGEIDDTLTLLRNTHAKAVFLATNGMEVKEVASKVSSVYQQYRYDPVNPQTACLELGIQVDTPQEAIEWFAKLVPKLPPNRFGISPESPTVSAIRSWTEKKPIEVGRADWELEFSDIMLRSLPSRVGE